MKTVKTVVVKVFGPVVIDIGPLTGVGGDLVTGRLYNRSSVTRKVKSGRRQTRSLHDMISPIRYDTTTLSVGHPSLVQITCEYVSVDVQSHYGIPSADTYRVARSDKT